MPECLHALERLPCSCTSTSTSTRRAAKAMPSGRSMLQRGWIVTLCTGCSLCPETPMDWAGAPLLCRFAAVNTFAFERMPHTHRLCPPAPIWVGAHHNTLETQHV